MMVDSYLPVLVLIVIAMITPIGILISSHVLGPRVQDDVKDDSYECGVPAVGSPKLFPVKFHRIAILFLLFDVEAALLFPWAVIYKDKLLSWGPGFLMMEFLIFLAVLLAGFFYAWKHGALEWE